MKKFHCGGFKRLFITILLILIIVCGVIKESTLSAAKACNIFVYKLNLKKLI